MDLSNVRNFDSVILLGIVDENCVWNVTAWMS